MAFKFGNNLVRIEIENHVFHVPVSEQLKDKILKAKDIIKENENKWDITDIDGEAAVVKLFSGVIDDVLGYGAFDKIFSDREINAYDTLAVFIYICVTITEFCKKLNAGNVTAMDNVTTVDNVTDTE